MCDVTHEVTSKLFIASNNQNMEQPMTATISIGNNTKVIMTSHTKQQTSTTYIIVLFKSRISVIMHYI